MDSLETRLMQWNAYRTLEDEERKRIAFLNKPPAKNPPGLVAPTKCRVLRPFFVGGKRAEVGELVTLTRDDARSLEAIGRVKLLKGDE